MFYLYFLAFLPILVGLVLSLTSREVCWGEWVLGSVAAFIVAGAFHAWAFWGQVGDTETWSGQIISARHIPAWREQYEEAIYRTETYTDSEGETQSRTVFSHYETRRRWHDPTWTAYSNIGTSYRISQSHYRKIISLFGEEAKEKGVRRTGETSSRMIEGDPYDYVGINKNGWVEPVNKSVRFTNRLKAAKTIYTNYTPDERFAEALHEYPSYESPWNSRRLMGEARNIIDPFRWEQINAVLGTTKFINLICVGFGDLPEDVADDQIARWLGGKKNDFIIFFGNGWSRVFSWSEQELCKSNVATLFLNPTSDTLLEDLQREITLTYELVDWDNKFKYIQVEPQTHHVVIYLVVLIITQGGLYYVFHNASVFGLEPPSPTRRRGGYFYPRNRP